MAIDHHGSVCRQARSISLVLAYAFQARVPPIYSVMCPASISDAILVLSAFRFGHATGFVAGGLGAYLHCVLGRILDTILSG